MRLRNIKSFSQDHRVKDEVGAWHILICLLSHYFAEG